MIIGARWRGSPGGTGPARRGAICPREFGPWQTVWERHLPLVHGRHLRQDVRRGPERRRRRWTRVAGADLGGLHQRPGPPARGRRTAAAAAQGAESNYTDLPSSPPTTRWAVPAAVDHQDPRADRSAVRPVTLLLTPGQAGDNPSWRRCSTYARPSDRQRSGCWPTRPTRTLDPHRAAAGGSRTPSPSAPTRSTTARPRAHEAAGRPVSTPRPTATATPSNAASTASNNGAASPPATTSTP